MAGNRVGRLPCAAFLAAALGLLLGVSPAPANADTFPDTLTVAGRNDVVEVTKGTRLRLAWNFPTATFGRVPHWDIRVGSRPITCEEDISSLVPGTWFAPTSLERSGSRDLDTSGPDFHEGASYFVRGCLRLDATRHHETNQVEIRLVTIVGTRPTMVLPRTPLIASATPVRPGYMIGVFGQDFGDRPGRLFLDTGTVTLSLGELDWHSRGIAGRVPRVVGIRDGTAFLIVERADGSRSPRWSVRFVATREVRVVPGGEVRVDSCSDEAGSNSCGSPAYPHAPSFSGHHGSLFVVAASGERGTDQFSIALANGWRFHGLEYSVGNRDAPPVWNLRTSDPTNPHIQVHWRNPGGFDVRVIYGFDLYIVGPAGVPHR